MIARITTDGKRILLDVPYMGGRGRTLAKSIPGATASWDKTVTPNKFKGWTYPLTMTTCRAMRATFGQNLEILPALRDWAKAEVQREREMDAIKHGDADLSAAKLLRVAQIAPELFRAMNDRPYQLNGAAFITAGNGTLLGDDPGLGKTLQALAALVEKGSLRILVACPRTVTRTVWARETNRWAPKITPFVVQGTRAEREAAIAAFEDTPYSGPKMLIINTEMVRVRKGSPDVPQWPFLFEHDWDAIIFDESHQSLASTKNVQSKGITQVRYGAMQLRKKLWPGGIALALSGTPARSDLKKFWGTLNWLRPDVFSSFWNWAKAHFEVDDSGYGMVVGKEPKDPDAFWASIRPYYLARDKTTAAPDLPPITYAGTPILGSSSDANYVQLDMEPEQAAAYTEMQKMAAATIEGGQLNATGVLAEITRLRQFALSYGRLTTAGEFEPSLPSAKYDWIVQFLRERENTGGKVVITSSFTSWIKVLARHLERDGFPVMTLTGETSDRDRESLVRRFASPYDKARVAIINTKAGGVGITLDAADEMIITDLPWKSDDERQVTDRIHRVSRIHNVIVYRLVSAGTVDEWMAGLTEDQRRILATDPEKIRAMFEEAGK